MPIGAIAGASVIGAGSSIISGNKSAGAVKDSAAATNETNRYIYDTTRADNAPYRQVGNAALGKLASMYGVGPNAGDTTDWGAFVNNNSSVYQAWQADPQKLSAADYGRAYYQNDLNYHQGGHVGVDGNYAADANAGYAGIDLTPYKSGTAGSASNYGGFETSPGYQFRLDEGMKAIERSAAARGGLNSGATMKALNRYAQGTASSEYENYANRLAALAGVGQNANSSNAQAGQAFASGTAQTNAAAGNATASAYQNTGNAINSGVQNLTSAYLYNKGYGGFGG